MVYDSNTGSYYMKLPVAGKAPNELGLYGMSGGVWEWCEDDVPNGDDYYNIRGGCYHTEAEYCLPGYSLSQVGAPTVWTAGPVGLRLAM